MYKVDLNSDIGESFGIYKIGDDESVIKYVTSVNIACGFHGGDPQVMNNTVKLAMENNVAIGAHPGFPDLMGFGRRNMAITADEAKTMVIYQVGALYGFVKSHGALMQHVKPHGALYNMAASDYKLARAIAEAVYSVDENLILMGLSGSEIIRAGKDVGLLTASEVFADRAYTSLGTLVPRNVDGAVIYDKNEVSQRVLDMVLHGKITAIDGTIVKINADSICVHGDTKEAKVLVSQIKQTLTDADVELVCIKEKLNSSK